ncbi:hypothetical protein [Pseudoalteromonas sp. OOF1S-7]|nr:hypothetical protein [Pseudoalteromonas sp. OOF1S-7]MCG7536067.1 hypothetical protein [Pseudoalteromonas sp. OOF1S-7]
MKEIKNNILNTIKGGIVPGGEGKPQLPRSVNLVLEDKKKKTTLPG